MHKGLGYIHHSDKGCFYSFHYVSLFSYSFHSNGGTLSVAFGPVFGSRGLFVITLVLGNLFIRHLSVSTCRQCLESILNCHTKMLITVCFFSSADGSCVRCPTGSVLEEPYFDCPPEHRYT